MGDFNKELLKYIGARLEKYREKCFLQEKLQRGI